MTVPAEFPFVQFFLTDFESAASCSETIEVAGEAFHAAGLCVKIMTEDDGSRPLRCECNVTTGAESAGS